MIEAASAPQIGRVGGRLAGRLGRAARWFSRTVDNAINPIVVKELRQAVNGRFVAAALTLFLGISVVTIAMALVDSRGRVEAEAGADVLVGLNATLLGVCLFLLPLQAGWRFAGERSDQNVDLMFITTIAPRSIIAGKLGATVMLAGVIYAACLPFMTLTYLLRGVDLPTIALMIVVGFATVIGGVMLALFAASAPMHRGFRVLMAVGVLGLLAVTYQGLVGWATASLVFGTMGLSTDPAEFWGALLTAGLLFFSGVYLLFRFAVAMISAPTANRAPPVRLAMMGVWVVFTGVMWTIVFLSGDGEPLGGWYVASVLLFSLGLVIAVCERDRWGPRVARTIPRRPVGWLGALLLYSGSVNGLLWAGGMILLCTVGFLAFPAVYEWIGALFPAGGKRASWRSVSSGHDEAAAMRIALGLAGYIYVYAMAGLLVRRYLLKRVLPAAHTWAVGLVLGGLACALPPMLAFLLQGELAFEPGARWWMLGNPASLFDGEGRASASLVFVGSCAAVLTIFALPWAVDQLAAFRAGNGEGMTDAEVADAGGRIARQALTVGGLFTGLAGLGVWVGWLESGRGWVGWLTAALAGLAGWAWLAGRRVVWRQRWGRRMGRLAALALLPLAPAGTAAGLASLIAAGRARRAEAALASGSAGGGAPPPGSPRAGDWVLPEAASHDEAPANG